MLSIDPEIIATKDLHQFMVGAIAPRPIAWASTVDENGQPNLAPYSFFNVFSSNPPILVFSSNRRVVGNTTKDTLHNVEKTREVVINVVPYALVQQMAVTSVEFPSDVNEFDKAGVTMLASELVKPFRVKESPVQFECKVSNIIPLGEEGGAGHLIICKVVKLHIDEAVLDEQDRIDPHKLDLMGRLGKMYYTRASGAAISVIPQSHALPVIGFDGLPKELLESVVFTGNNLGILAGMKAKPSKEAMLLLQNTDIRVKEIVEAENIVVNLQQYAKQMLDAGDIELGATLAFLSITI